MVFFNTDKYCSDTFWNSSVSWDTDNPKFSTCFKNSLFLIPSGILWLTSVLWIIWILKWPFNKAPKATTKVFSGLFWSKLMLTVVLFGAIAAQLSFVYIEGSAMAWSDVAFFVVATTTTMLTFGLLIFEKVNQVRSSLPMTIYWPLLFLATLPSLLDSLQNLDSNSQSFNCQIASMALALPIILGLCVLNLFADLSGLDLKDQEVAPLHLASHFSFLFFGWFENLVFKGYKKPLTQKDLPHVPDFLKVRGNVDTFMQNWDYHIKANAVDFSAKTGKKKVLTLWKPLIKSFGLRFGVGNFLGLIHYTAVFSSPMVRTYCAFEERIWLMIFEQSIFVLDTEASN
jgi:ATP-binding cassette subfamily C (CFTR/MRP) protein 2